MYNCYESAGVTLEKLLQISIPGEFQCFLAYPVFNVYICTPLQQKLQHENGYYAHVIGASAVLHTTPGRLACATPL